MAMATEIAAWIGAELSSEMESDADFSEVAAIAAAGPASIVFASDAKSLGSALASYAGLILANRTAVPPGSIPDARVVAVPDARLAFAKVAQRLRPLHPLTTIHAAAIIDPSATIGQGSSIGANTFIGQHVVIGRYCDIGPNVTIYSAATLGDRVHVQAGSVLASKGFGYARDPATGEYVLFPQQGTLVIEDDVEIGANTTIDRGALGETRIGTGSKLDNLVHIGHNCLIGRNVIIAAQTGISGSSVIEDGAILGGQVGIGEHAVVGKGVILGGGAGVLTGKKMQGPGEVFWGRPARPLKEYLRDLARLKRR